MSETIFLEIANEIKGLNNHAMALVNQGDLIGAEVYYQKALEITKLCQYYDGMAIIYFNLANIEVLKDDLLEAITYSVLAIKMHNKAQSSSDKCDEMLNKLALATMKKGIEYEKKGQLKEALEYYYACLNYIEDNYQQAIQQEIELIKRVMPNEIE